MSGKSILRSAACLAMATALASAPAFADFTYEQTGKITGGSMVRLMKMVPGGGKALEPQVSTHLLKGNRMATVNARSISVVDLDKETMTEIDLEKNTYAVITLAEFKQAMEAMQKKMTQQKKQGEASMEFTFDVKETGEKKNIGGFNTREVVLLVTMAIKDPKHPEQVGKMEMNSDLWLAPSVAGYQEVRQFQMRLAEKLGFSQEGMRMGAMAAMQPGMSEGMAKLAKEASKLEGIPIMTIVRMTGAGMGGDMSDSSGAQRPSAGEVAQQESGNQVGNAIGGLGGAAANVLGGLGGFGRKKKAQPKEDAPPPTDQPKPAAAPAKPGAPGTLMEMTTEMTSFSSAPVDTSKFTPPAGCKEVEHSMKKALREASK
ncbi:MAG: hypothetical protein IPP47_32150 [Bryobacterales bacterium]|nr:hypothetical protein [Bryobacterales bacterium]